MMDEAKAFLDLHIQKYLLSYLLFKNLRGHFSMNIGQVRALLYNCLHIVLHSYCIAILYAVNVYRLFWPLL